MDSEINRKEFLVHLLNTLPMSAAQIAARENINYSTLNKYKRLAAKGKPFFNNVGRPPLIDEIGESSILTNLQRNGDCINKVYFKGLLMQERSETYTRRFGMLETPLRPMSKATVEKYLKLFAIRLSALLGRQAEIQRRNRPRRLLVTDTVLQRNRLRRYHDFPSTSSDLSFRVQPTVTGNVLRLPVQSSGPSTPSQADIQVPPTCMIM